MFLDVFSTCIEYFHDFSWRDVDSLWARLVNHFVDQPDIGKSTSGHDFIIASARSIRVEVLLFNALRKQVLGSWRCLWNVASWRNVVSGDGVSEVAQAVCIGDAVARLDFLSHFLEEGRVVDVSWLFIPLVKLASRGFQSVPSVSPFRN